MVVEKVSAGVITFEPSFNSNDWTANNVTATVGTVYSATSSGMSSPGLMFDGDTSTSPSLTADGTVYTMLTGVSIACSSSLRINANANSLQVSVNGGTFVNAASVGTVLPFDLTGCSRTARMSGGEQWRPT